MTAPVVDVTTVADAIAVSTGLGLADTTPEYQAQVLQVPSPTGDPTTDLTNSLVVDSGSSVDWDCTANTPGSVAFPWGGDPLAWGTVIVALYQLARSTGYNQIRGVDPATWWRFPLGRFVLTTPGRDDLDRQTTKVTGYDLNYLLQKDPGDTVAFAAGGTYFNAVQTCFRKAGLIGSSAALGSVVDSPPTWSGKLLPSNATYPIGGGMSWLDIVNDLLAASGCRAIYPQPTGRWTIELIPTPASQSLLWTWTGSELAGVDDGDLDKRIVLAHSTQYNGDVWKLPNQWIFVQDGLTFVPIEGAGKVTVNNLTTPPGGQLIVNRILPSVRVLQASGQADLVTQANAIVADELAAAETMSFKVRPWPACRQFDVFLFRHQNLPTAATRRCQITSWSLPLWGSPMTVNVNTRGTT